MVRMIPSKRHEPWASYCGNINCDVTWCTSMSFHSIQPVRIKEHPVNVDVLMPFAKYWCKTLEWLVHRVCDGGLTLMQDVDNSRPRYYDDKNHVKMKHP